MTMVISLIMLGALLVFKDREGRDGERKGRKDERMEKTNRRIRTTDKVTWFLMFLLLTTILSCLAKIGFDNDRARWFDLCLCTVYVLITLGMITDFQDYELVTAVVLTLMQYDWSYYISIAIVLTPLTLKAYHTCNPFWMFVMLSVCLTAMSLMYLLPYLGDLVWSQVSTTIRGLVFILIVSGLPSD
jgi:hypothetical protein